MNRDVLVDTAVFTERPEARFWTGVVATPEAVLFPVELEAAMRLRAVKYIDERHILDESHRQNDGTEHDENDARATHVVIVGNAQPQPTLDATVRLINRRHPADPLPVENLFPELLERSAVPVDALEASRIIAHYPSDESTQHLLFCGIARALVFQAAQREKTTVVATVEHYMNSILDSVGVSYDVIADPRPIQEAREEPSMLMAIRIDIPHLFAEARANPASIAGIYLNDAQGHQGLGYFDSDLMPA